MTLFGVDASHYQSGLPVSSLRGQGFSFLVAKATQGSNWRDAAFPYFLAQAKQAGLLFAAYHYLEVGSYSAQAANTARVVPPAVPVWVDVEGGTTRDQAYAYATEARSRGLTVAGIYNASQPPAEYGWWRAAYGIDPTGAAPYAYAANGGDRSDKWSAGTTRHPDIWQFCQHGRIAGYGGDVDLNAYRGTLQQLASSGWFWVPPTLEDPLAGITLSDIRAEINAALADQGKSAVAAALEDRDLPGATWLEKMTDLHVAAAVKSVTGAQFAALGQAIAGVGQQVSGLDLQLSPDQAAAIAGELKAALPAAVLDALVSLAKGNGA